jgi:hypothetical protein
MDVCSDGHEEIVHEGRNCPTCAIVEENKELKEKVAELQTLLDDAEADVSELTEKLGNAG